MSRAWFEYPCPYCQVATVKARTKEDLTRRFGVHLRHCPAFRRRFADAKSKIGSWTSQLPIEDVMARLAICGLATPKKPEGAS